MTTEVRIGLAMAAMAFVCVFAPTEAMAFSAPAAGSFAYDIYDIGVNKVLKGPIGFVGGVTAVAVGAVATIQARLSMALPALLGGAVLLKADTIVESLGLMA